MPASTDAKATPEHNLSNKQIHVIKTAQKGTKTWFELDDHKWISADDVNNDGYHWFHVPLICQRPEMPTGCEITAVTMMLEYFTGKKIDKMKMEREMPRNSDPDKGFVGDPCSKTGWYIFPAGLVNLVNHYTNGRAWNMTGCPLSTIKAQIKKNHPVVMWMADIDNFPNHALTVYGYDSHHFFLNDPWMNLRIKKSWSYLRKHRDRDKKRTLGYY